MLSGHSAFLHRSEPVLDHAVLLPRIDPSVLMARGLLLTNPTNVLFINSAPIYVHRLLMASPTSAKNFLRCPGQVDRASRHP